jgi:hypothetical protein
VHEHRLGLIVGIVAHSYSPGTGRDCDLTQKAVASAASGLLHRQAVARRQGGNVDMLDCARQAPIRRHSADKPGIGGSLGTPQTVV